jgi:hypothetical protein
MEVIHDPQIDSEWARVRAASAVRGAVTAAVIAILALFSGELPLDDSKGTRGRAGAVDARLVLGRARGRPRSNQKDLESSWFARLARGSLLIPGAVWRDGEAVFWSPRASWRNEGAVEVRLALVEIDRVVVSDLGRSGSGCVVCAGPDELWLLLKRPAPSTVGMFEPR